MRKGAGHTRVRGVVSSTLQDDEQVIFISDVCRHWLPVADKQIGARPELAGVGIATVVLDALKWAA